MTVITQLARSTIEQFLASGRPPQPPADPPGKLAQPAAAFVTLHQRDGQLRGCIGTIRPTKATLAEEIIANAIAAATRDPRFAPLQVSELPNIKLSIDVLGPVITEPHPSRLNPRIFGLIVSSADGRQGVLLPDLPTIDTVEDQIAICREKASIGPHEQVIMSKFQVTRYEE